jgi:hypothetical protein
MLAKELRNFASPKSFLPFSTVVPLHGQGLDGSSMRYCAPPIWVITIILRDCLSIKYLPAMFRAGSLAGVGVETILRVGDGIDGLGVGVGVGVAVAVAGAVAGAVGDDMKKPGQRAITINAVPMRAAMVLMDGGTFGTISSLS